MPKARRTGPCARVWTQPLTVDAIPARGELGLGAEGDAVGLGLSWRGRGQGRSRQMPEARVAGTEAQPGPGCLGAPAGSPGHQHPTQVQGLPRSATPTLC